MEKAWRKEKKKEREKKKEKPHAACVNWLMLPPLCQINSTGQGREGGREKCERGGCVESFHQRLFHSPQPTPPSFFL